MVSHVSTVTLSGIHAHSVNVQVQSTPGRFGIQIVGLPDNAVKESKERVSGAFHALGISLPAKKITVNLSPADLAKEGSHFDLPIAVSMLIALKILPQDAAQDAVFMGELGLDGSILPIIGTLPAAIHAASEEKTSIFIPIKNAPEASWADGISVYGVKNLIDIIHHMNGQNPLTPHKPNLEAREEKIFADIKDIKGQESLKRAAEIAMAGGHNMLMVGPPGSGKSMIASRLSHLAPDLNAEEALDVSMIHSIAGLIGADGLVRKRPFRDPHHSASAVALCGGGLKAKPGEMSLAHRGILFLDELAEFPRQVLETLRQPLETGSITVSRANHHVTYPATFQLIAAMNPCPCGYHGHHKIACHCTQKQVQSYNSRLSGPLMDRIDIHVHVQPVDIKDLSLPSAKEGTKEVRARIEKARNIQQQRFVEHKIQTNSELSGKILEEVALLNDECQKMFTAAADRYNLSARAYHRTLKVARTIADLAHSQNIERPHLIEALAYRQIHMT